MCVRAGGRAVGRLDVNTLKIRIQLNAYYFHEINWQSTQQINENIWLAIQKYFNENGIKWKPLVWC